MAFSFEFFSGDGVNRDFAINNPYLDRSHVTIEVDGVSVPFVFVNGFLARTDTAPVAGVDNVKVLRTTPIASPLADFVDGSVLEESDLDIVTLQLLYINQEGQDNLSTAADAADNAKASEIAAAASATAADTSRGLALAAQINAQTAEANAAGSASAASTSAGNAATSEANAATSEANAASSASAAATSAGNAATSEANASGSETAAASSAGSAATSASNAATSEGNASGSAAAAATSAGNAATSETNAAEFALLNTTSNSSVTISTGPKLFTTVDERAFTIGQFVKASSAADPTTHYLWGQVNTWVPGSNFLSIIADVAVGSGSRSDWIIAGTGERGEQGAAGAGSVDSVFGRSGAVTAQNGDYDAGQITETASAKILTNTERTKLSGIATAATANPNAIDNVLEDTSPQLGGNLDANGNEIRIATGGSASDPQLTFSGDENTGFYRVGVDSFAAAAGGVEVMRWSETGSAATTQLNGELDGQGNAAVDVPLDVVAEETASFTFGAGQAGRLVPCNSGSAMNATVPSNATTAFAIGTTLAIWNQGAGVVTWVAGGGVTLNRDAALTLVSNGQHAISFAIKVATNTWVVAGGLEAT